MGRTFDKSVLVGVGLVVALLVGNAGLAYRNTRHLLEDAGLIDGMGCTYSGRPAAPHGECVACDWPGVTASPRQW
jgi:hypothetical protein